MKICLILEGSYPYVTGGVSNWVDGFIRALPEHEFVLWSVSDRKSKRGQFVYDLPANVVEMRENFLDTALNLKINRNRNIRYSQDEKSQIGQLIRCKSPDWKLLFTSFNEKLRDPVELFTSEDFLTILKEFCNEEFSFVGFADLYWTIRSMFLPLLFLIGQPMPEADLYHSISTGYAGILGGLGAMIYNKPYVLTEHGIYTREREEEILRADWVVPYFKELWISMFYMYSRFAYTQANRITSLFEHASLTQQDLGCHASKCDVVGNGINVKKFTSIPLKKKNEWIDIAAIVRIAPIKDIKTMIYTFSRLKQEVGNARLHILGHVDDEEYYQECLSLVKYLDIQDVNFAGVVDIPTYLRQIDFTLLTSISEGQPLAILESLAARRPLVATDVGSCRELIEGKEGDHFGLAGIYVPPMSQTDLLNALIEMCRNEKMRKEMGKAGQARVKKHYGHQGMVKRYMKVYDKAVKSWQA